GLRMLGKGLRIQARHLGLRVELDPGDPEPPVDALEMHLGRGVDAPGRELGPAQARRQGHGEAPRVRRADQLLGIGSGSVLEPRAERVGALEGAPAELDPALALAQRAFPDGIRVPYRHRDPPDGAAESARAPYAGCRVMSASLAHAAFRTASARDAAATPP